MYSHLFQNVPQFVVIHTVKGFDITNKAEVDVFLELSCFFDDPVAILSLVPLPFPKISLNIWKFMVHVLLKPGWENFEHYFTSVWDECNCAVVWAFFGITLLCDWNGNWPFPVLCHCCIFHICRHIAVVWTKSAIFLSYACTVIGFGGVTLHLLRQRSEFLFHNKLKPYKNRFYKLLGKVFQVRNLRTF